MLQGNQVFVLADRRARGAVHRIWDDQGRWSMPENLLARASDRRPTLCDIIKYHAYDDVWVPDMLAGRTMDEAGYVRSR